MVLLSIEHINQWERKLALPLILKSGTFGLPVGMLFLFFLLAGCSSHTSTNPAHAQHSAVTSSHADSAETAHSLSPIEPSVAGLVATLEDEVRDLPDGQIAWTTYWKLCWEPYAGAQEYELEPMTGEGAGRRRVRQTGVCYRVEVAKGQNAKAQGFFNRELMLASLAGQMTYRVRAVLSGDRVSQWSATAIVGQSGKPASAPRK